MSVGFPKKTRSTTLSCGVVCGHLLEIYVHAVNGVSVLRVMTKPVPCNGFVNADFGKLIITMAQEDCSIWRNSSKFVSPTKKFS